eukprot:1038192-Alexandrium_andersonii.AAC.1
MSASLVGSEMCIRDRSTPHASTPLLERDPRDSGAGHLRGAPVGSGSVSYTHLTLPTICSV